MLDKLKPLSISLCIKMKAYANCPEILFIAKLIDDAPPLSPLPIAILWDPPIVEAFRLCDGTIPEHIPPLDNSLIVINAHEEIEQEYFYSEYEEFLQRFLIVYSADRSFVSFCTPTLGVVILLCYILLFLFIYVWYYYSLVDALQIVICILIELIIIAVLFDYILDWCDDKIALSVGLYAD